MVKRSFIQKVDKVWGSEEWIVNGKYCGKILRVLPGHQGSLHCHPKKSETFFGFDGEGTIEVDGKACFFGIDDIVDIPAGVYHRFINDSEFADFVLMEFSTKHDDKDVIRKEESK
jgi:mannose-6-phosphate isomerase-like protein (cupin superfamily)